MLNITKVVEFFFLVYNYSASIKFLREYFNVTMDQKPADCAYFTTSATLETDHLNYDE